MTPDKELERLHLLKQTLTRGRDTSLLSDKAENEARRRFGSVKEFRFAILEENLDCTVAQLSAMLKVSYRQTERIMAEWKGTQRHRDYLWREWSRLYRSDQIDPAVKFDKVTALLKTQMQMLGDRDLTRRALDESEAEVSKVLREYDAVLRRIDPVKTV